MANNDSDSLIRLFEKLSSDNQQALLSYAEFLASRSDNKPDRNLKPVDIPRPESETVVGAIKRLKQTYPMIESMSIFSKASDLMMAHMVHGKGANEVIDEMEQLFETFYKELEQSKNG